MQPLLEVKDYSISFSTYNGEVKAVRDASFSVGRQEILAIVGESGSGKSVITQTMLKLTPGIVKSGSVIFDGKDITNASEAELRKIRGKDVGIIFQDAMTALNPTMKIGKQIAECIMLHQKCKPEEAKQKTLDLLKLVGINNVEKRYNQYVFNLSGGMRQRVMIAMALSCEPKLLIADEPTTALDVTIQAQILDLLSELVKKVKCSIILITHDLGVVASKADRIVVMYAGRPVEVGSAHDIFYNPKHPYTKGLLRSIPRLDSNSKEELYSIVGTPPDAINPPLGCTFSPRCKFCMRICKEQVPSYKTLNEGHISSCFLLDEGAKEVRKKFEEE